jgi:hypothetical protein
MIKKRNLFLVLSLLMLLFSSLACLGGASLSISDSGSSIEAPLHKKADSIDLAERDKEALIVDLFGYNQTLYPNEIDVRVTDDSASSVHEALESALIDENWRYEYTLMGEVWRNGDHLLYLYIIDNLSSSDINELSRSYGMKDLEPGQTLIITYLIDTGEPLPNPTQTADMEFRNQTQTAVVESEYRTQTAESQRMTQEVLEATQQSIAQSTQTAIAATQKAESMQFTATAIAPLLAEMGTEFDGENSIPDGMTIAREDPTRWDLTSRPGWLHIKGREVKHYDEDWITKNVFVYPLEYTNISIITRVDADMNKGGQSVWMALSPSTYESDGYAVELGLSLGKSEGRKIYAWGCDSDYCSSWLFSNYDYSFDDQIGFSGLVYLRLDVLGTTYTFYFSENGQDWIYLGSIDDFSAGDNLILAAGGGDEDYEFDAYFDFLHISPILSD